MMMERPVDLKRKSRNLSEKKRRDQFNNLINELNNLIDPHFNNHNTADDEDEICCGVKQASSVGVASTGRSDNDFNNDRHNSKHQQTNQINPVLEDDFYSQNERGQNISETMTRSFTLPTSGLRSKGNSTTSSITSSSLKQRKMDKSSVLKCAMEFLKKYTSPQNNNSDQAQAGDKQFYRDPGKGEHNNPESLDTSPWKPDYITDDEFSVQMLEALDAFIVVCEVNSDARIIYSSDTLTNLLNYTGTCNSLRHHDFVSLFDIIAPHDKPLIEKLFCEQLDIHSFDGKQQQQHENTVKSHTTTSYPTDAPTDNKSSYFCSSSSTAKINGSGQQNFSDSFLESSLENNQNEYISLVANFRNGLNLTEIKQRRLQQKSGAVLQPFGLNQKSQADNLDPIYMNQHQQQQQHELQELQQSDQDIYMQIVVEHESTGGRSQQSIAEQQHHLLSDGRREQQEHNQQQQEQQRQVVDLMQVEGKQLNRENSASVNDDQQLLDRSPEIKRIAIDSVETCASSSGTNSDENDQPSGTGSDDASDSNQSQSVTKTERRYRHHHHSGHNSGAQHGHKRQKQGTLASNRQQYEVVRLMATFKSLMDNNVLSDVPTYGLHTCEDPKPTKSYYFICIGRLEVPRLSYDLKIIVPPLRGGTNVFHNNQFVSKHTLKWRFLWVDNRAPSIIGYLPFEVLGTSGYDYYHWDDLDKLVISHEGLMRDGQASSGPYRFLTKGQQWIWLQTKYNVILKQLKFILCTHTVIGFDESDGYVNL